VVEPGDAPHPVVARHLTLDQLPPAVAERLSFASAAPRRLRKGGMPDAVRDELAHLWDGVVADVYDEVAGLRRFRALGPSTVERALRRIAERVLETERLVIHLAVQHPMSRGRRGRHVALAGLGGASAAAAEELTVVTSAGTAAAVAILTAVAGEVFETYVAASARTREYQRAGRSPDADAVLADLAESAGYASSVGRRANQAMAHEAAAWMGELLVTRTATRFSRALVPVAGVALGGGLSMFNVRRVADLPLRPPSEDELIRMARDLVADRPTSAAPPPPPPELHEDQGRGP
jgi:hypothetical protein